MVENEEAFEQLGNSLEGQKIKGRKVQLKMAFKYQPEDKFRTFEEIFRVRQNEMKTATPEEIKEMWDVPLKDKLVPYHSFSYETQIQKKAEILNGIYVKLQGKLKLDSPNDIPEWLISAPCEFTGVIECDEDQRQGYRNKVEFSIGHKFEDNQLTIGFQKGALNKGVFLVDDPVNLPNISAQSVECAARVQTVLRTFDTKHEVGSFNPNTHQGCFRLLIYKESK